MLISGLLIIAAGILLALFNAGTLPVEYKRIVFSWPMLVVAIGFSSLFGGRRKLWWGVMLMVVGGFFLIRRMEIASCYINGENIWATILLSIGIVLVLKSCFLSSWHRRMHDPEKMKEWQKRRNDCQCYPHYHHSRSRHEFNQESRNSSEYIERTCIFGGGKEKVVSQNFKGGEISCVFGSLQLDFSAAQLAEGENYLEINTVFGGIELYIPADWSIEIRQTNVFGNFVDRRPKASFEVADNRKLILAISSIFGGGEIKSNA